MWLGLRPNPVWSTSGTSPPKCSIVLSVVSLPPVWGSSFSLPQLPRSLPRALRWQSPGEGDPDEGHPGRPTRCSFRLPGLVQAASPVPWMASAGAAVSLAMSLATAVTPGLLQLRPLRPSKFHLLMFLRPLVLLRLTFHLHCCVCRSFIGPSLLGFSGA